jgi:UDP-2,3-diacylglucosamine pyrophosphatase LpxH
VKPALVVDKLYVISDLHLGGEAGFQIFGSGTELEWLVRHLADTDPDEDVALVINGDFVDFLAEAPATYFDPYGALRKLERIALEDPAFKGVFAQLTYFLSKPKRRLVVNLGNHDLELALPWVRQRLEEILCGTNATATSRLHFVLDGSGVLCGVGAQSVLCLHGNEVDAWNPADYERIRQIGRDVQLGRPVKAWIPNRGTQLVIEVMNRIKRGFPFVDLLKPEVAAVVPTLLACAPRELLGSLERVGRMADIGLGRARASIVKPAGMLGEEPEGGLADPAATTLPGLLGPAPGAGNEGAARELMRLVEEQARTGVDPMALVGIAGDQRLDALSAAGKWIAAEPGHEVLREALEYLDKDRSFDIADRDETARRLDDEVAPAIDIVVAGHTHLERALHRLNGGGCYFNSGTWARLIRIAPAVRGDPAAFKRVYDQLKDGRMAQLDAEGLVHKPCTVVAIWREAPGGGASAELRHVKPDAAGLGLVADSPTSRMRVG